MKLPFLSLKVENINDKSEIGKRINGKVVLSK